MLHRGQSVELFEAPINEQGVLLVYRAKVRPEGLKGRAYLEMHCRINGREFFSKGYAFGEAVEGSEDWRSIETPFMVRAGENLDRVRLNLAIEGEGKVWIKDVELTAAPLAES